MSKITVTIDTELHKIVPKSLPRDLSVIAADAGEINGAPMSAFCFKAAYMALLNNIPDTLPDVVVHSGEPCAFANGDDILSMQCGNTSPIALSATQSNWHKTPIFTHPPAQPDIKTLRDALEQLARLGNGDHYGNSIGNSIAIDALKAVDGIAPAQPDTEAIVRAALEAAASMIDRGIFLHDKSPEAMIAKHATQSIRAIDPQTIIDAATKGQS